MNERLEWEPMGMGKWNHRCKVDGRGKRVMTELQIAQLRGCVFCKGYPPVAAQFQKRIYVMSAAAYWKAVTQ